MEQPHQPKPVDTGTFEQLLEARAPAVKQWPAWFRRNFTPAALWTIGAVVLTSTVTVTTFIVTSSADRASNAAIAGKIDGLAGKLNDQAEKLQMVKCTTDKLAYAHAQEEWVITADWNRRHRRPPPAQPREPSSEGCPQ